MKWLKEVHSKLFRLSQPEITPIVFDGEKLLIPIVKGSYLRRLTQSPTVRLWKNRLKPIFYILVGALATVYFEHVLK